MRPYIISVIKALIISYVLSAAFLLVLTVLLYLTDIGQVQLRIGFIVAYILSITAGGFFVGRKVKNREFLWGLIVGLLYYCVHVSAAVAMEGIHPEGLVPATALALLCMGSGMLGGMLS